MLVTVLSLELRTLGTPMPLRCNCLSMLNAPALAVSARRSASASLRTRWSTTRTWRRCEGLLHNYALHLAMGHCRLACWHSSQGAANVQPATLQQAQRASPAGQQAGLLVTAN